MLILFKLLRCTYTYEKKTYYKSFELKPLVKAKMLILKPPLLFLSKKLYFLLKSAYSWGWPPVN